MPNTIRQFKISRAAVVREARSYLFTPFVAGGESREGLWCVGLVVAVGRKFGVFPPEFKLPNFTPPYTQAFTEWLPRWFELREGAAPEPGDLLVMQTTVSPARARKGALPEPHHCYLVSQYEADPSDLGIIGVDETRQIVTEQRLTDQYKARIWRGAWVWRALASDD